MIFFFNDFGEKDWENTSGDKAAEWAATVELCC